MIGYLRFICEFSVQVLMVAADLPTVVAYRPADALHQAVQRPIGTRWFTDVREYRQNCGESGI
ncbi:MAG: hypothetical protein JNL58_02570 [Planctomyces sp.]|nr:hypothetical protein [Planctomyces sp.]